MKKIIFLLLLSNIAVFASNSNPIKIQIIEKILNNISIKEEMIVWSNNNEILGGLKNLNSLNSVDECSNANILIVDNIQNINKDCLCKYIFVLNYNLLTEVPKSFGALFWKKGRPNIVIIQPRIDQQNIRVTNNLLPYVEEKVW